MKLTKKQRHIAYINATYDYKCNDKEGFTHGLCWALRYSMGNIAFNISSGTEEEILPELTLLKPNKRIKCNKFWWGYDGDEKRAMALAFLIAMTE